MNFCIEDTRIITRYIKQALAPTTAAEILSNGDIAHKGRIRRWFMDILEGQCPVMANINQEGDWDFVKMRYQMGMSWGDISQDTMTPLSTVRYRCNRFFTNIVNNMPAAQGKEILRINARHEAEKQPSARWESGIDNVKQHRSGKPPTKRVRKRLRQGVYSK